MSKRSDIDKMVNETLESLSGIQKAEPAPWFFTRIKAKLERDKHNIWETTGSYMARPAIAFVGLLFILCINAFILFEKSSTTDQGSTYSPTEPVEEYVLRTANSNSDYENLEP